MFTLLINARDPPLFADLLHSDFHLFREILYFASSNKITLHFSFPMPNHAETISLLMDSRLKNTP